MNLLRLKLHLLFRKKEKVITRGVFASLLALKCKKFNKVCFDARGAYEAEWPEYLKDFSPTLVAKMKDVEKEALMKSNFRIAVSQKLVDYWKENYGYQSLEHVVIPCTIDSNKAEYDNNAAPAIRKLFGVKDNEVLLVYSGSSAQWQSFKKLEEAISTAFSKNPNIKLLMLCKPGGEKALADKFPEKVIQAWVKPQEVPAYLSAADYGLIIREPSVTNKVSSPVKFAEYMAAGLPVIISEGIGDYSAFVKEKNCGMPVDSVDWAKLQCNSERERIKEVAKTYLTKSACKEQYRKVVEF